MKGVLLCGGAGIRLRPLTGVLNKHLIRIGKLAMAEYPLLKLIDAGISEILIVSGGEHSFGVRKYFSDGSRWGVKINHAFQKDPGGIAQALALAEPFIGKQEKLLVILGDNLFSQPLFETVQAFETAPAGTAQLFMIDHAHPERFGVVRYQGAEPVEILEKPAQPPSSKIVVGIYGYDRGVFDVIRAQAPSGRGEFEITDVNNAYLRRRTARLTPLAGWWHDCGTMESILAAEESLREDRQLGPAAQPCGRHPAAGGVPA